MTRSSGSSLRLIRSTARYSGIAGSSVWAASAASGESDELPELAARRPDRSGACAGSRRASAGPAIRVLAAAREPARDVEATIVGIAAMLDDVHAKTSPI